MGGCFLFVYLRRAFVPSGDGGLFCCFAFTQIEGHIPDNHMSCYMTVMNI